MATYFVSYSYASATVSGFGNLTITGTRSIEGADDIRNIQRKIEEDLHLENVIVLYFTRLDGHHR